MWSTSFKTPDDTSCHSTMHKDMVTTAKGGPMKCIANQVDGEGTGPNHFVQCDPAFNGSWMAFDNEDCDSHGNTFQFAVNNPLALQPDFEVRSIKFLKGQAKINYSFGGGTGQW
jgi:hypothetical protein